MESNSEADGPYTTANSRLLPAIFEPPKARNGRLKILEPRGRRRRPKAGDFKLLAAYVAAYVGVLIPKEDYDRFIDPRGEREWKRTLRAACDIEWRLQDLREFDDIPTHEYSVMREYVAHAWPFTKYFDGGWLIKWALRTTWTNRRKAYMRSNKDIEKRRRCADRSTLPPEDSYLLTGQPNRRHRASKLGQSLYCVGGCQRMLTIDQFPNDHVGICTMCGNNCNTASPPSQIHTRRPRARGGSVSTHELSSQEQSHLDVEPSVQRRTNPCFDYTAGESSTIHRRRNPHSVLSGSVTTYSDAGQYPSGRSTYGVTKPSQRGRRGHTKATALPVHPLINRSSQTPRNRATTSNLQELNKLYRNLSQADYNNSLQGLSRRTEEASLQHSQLSQDAVSQLTSETEDEDSSAVVTLYPVTAAVTKCTDEICKLWDVLDIVDIFPKTIWPNPNTPWPIGVLKEFRAMAQEYPDPVSRQGICAKFAQLVKTRRERSNAKSQWSIVDARTTHAWAKEQFGSPGSSDHNVDTEGVNTIGLRSSQYLRRPQKERSVLRRTDKGKQTATKITYSQKPRRRTIEIDSTSEVTDTGSASDRDSNR